jgi:hypothetical protein
MYLLKRGIFGVVIFFLNFFFFFLLLLALDGSILESFSLTDFTRAVIIFTLALSGLRYCGGMGCVASRTTTAGRGKRQGRGAGKQ